MPTPRCAFITTLLLAIFVLASNVTALKKTDPSQIPSQKEQPLTDLQRPLEEDFPTMTGCQLSCKNRYLKEVEKCRQLTPSTFKRQQCIKRTNYFGQTCESFCKSKYDNIPPLE